LADSQSYIYHEHRADFPVTEMNAVTKDKKFTRPPCHTAGKSVAGSVA
jgi:hypothetical protein